MTREEWAKLTDEERRIKVAELCGYTKIHVAYFTVGDTWENHGKLIAKEHNATKYARYVKVPDFLNDLNAMYEAEDMLTTDEANEYWAALLDIVNAVGGADWSIRRHYAHATAAQRAEAFVLVRECEKGRTKDEGK